MAIDWDLQIAALEKSTIAGHMFRDGNPPLTGSNVELGFYTDRPYQDAGDAACSLQQWVLDNSPFEIQLDFRFEAWNSKARIKVLWRDRLDDNGQKVVAKLFDWEVVTGRHSQSSNFAGQHELLGALMFRRFCEWINTIKEQNNG